MIMITMIRVMLKKDNIKNIKRYKKKVKKKRVHVNDDS